MYEHGLDARCLGGWRGRLLGIALLGFWLAQAGAETPILARVEAVESDGISVMAADDQAGLGARRWKIRLSDASVAASMLPGVRVQLWLTASGEVSGLRVLPEPLDQNSDLTGVRARLSRGAGSGDATSGAGSGRGGGHGGGGGGGGGGHGGGGGGGR